MRIRRCLRVPKWSELPPESSSGLRRRDNQLPAKPTGRFFVLESYQSYNFKVVLRGDFHKLTMTPPALAVKASRESRGRTLYALLVRSRRRQDYAGVLRPP